jgi:hypothetical protein
LGNRLDDARLAEFLWCTEIALSGFDIALSIALGVGLAAATGFRVFLPLLVVSIAGRYGFLPLSDDFAWMSSTAAITMFGVAALAEVVAYFVPGFDHLLDTIATPASIVAGIAVSAAVMTGFPPMLKWTLAIIAGGGAAGVTQGATVLLRAHSATLTAGIGNPLVAAIELFCSLAISFLSLSAPLIAIAVLGLLLLITFRWFRRSEKRS